MGWKKSSYVAIRERLLCATSYLDRIGCFSHTVLLLVRFKEKDGGKRLNDLFVMFWMFLVAVLGFSEERKVCEERWRTVGRTPRPRHSSCLCFDFCCPWFLVSRSRSKRQAGWVSGSAGCFLGIQSALGNFPPTPLDALRSGTYMWNSQYESTYQGER